MKKRSLSLLLVLVLSLSFTACNKNDTPKDVENKPNVTDKDNKKEPTTPPATPPPAGEVDKPTGDSSNNEEPPKTEIPKEDDKNTSTEPNNLKYDLASLDKTRYSWYFYPNTPREAEKYKEKYDLYYEGNKANKELYLTFDCGYENGITPKILDILKENNVKAGFFITSAYLKSSPDLVKRMIAEGHIVGNHSEDHPSMVDKAVEGRDASYYQLEALDKKFQAVVGKPIDRFFRPPMGEFSEASLALTKELGYKSIFWANAYKDYDVNNQPDPEESKKLLKGRTDNGDILLLHAVSKTNSIILQDLIDDWRAEGYVFKSLDQLPKY